MGLCTGGLRDEWQGQANKCSHISSKSTGYNVFLQKNVHNIHFYEYFLGEGYYRNKDSRAADILNLHTIYNDDSFISL
jgi:hypothetical protein